MTEREWWRTALAWLLFGGLGGVLLIAIVLVVLVAVAVTKGSSIGLGFWLWLALLIPWGMAVLGLGFVPPALILGVLTLRWLWRLLLARTALGR